MREVNPWSGIYYAIGPHDMYPIDYQLFNNSLTSATDIATASYTDRPADLWLSSTL
jgi:hypothetical protein